MSNQTKIAAGRDARTPQEPSQAFLGSRSTTRPAANTSDIFNTPIPHSDAVERAALGSMLIDRIAAEYVDATLREHHFYLPRNRALFVKIIALMRVGKAVDETLLVASLRVPNMEEVKDYIAKLITDTPSAANVEGYCTQLVLLDHRRARLSFALKVVRDEMSTNVHKYL